MKSAVFTCTCGIEHSNPQTRPVVSCDACHKILTGDAINAVGALSIHIELVAPLPRGFGAGQGKSFDICGECAREKRTLSTLMGAV